MGRIRQPEGASSLIQLRQSGKIRCVARGSVAEGSAAGGSAAGGSAAGGSAAGGSAAGGSAAGGSAAGRRVGEGAGLAASEPGASEPGACGIRRLFERLIGRFGEISGACLTLGLALVVEAQRRQEPVAWITSGGATFFPPDAARGGVDLETLVVVRLDDPQAGLPGGLARAAEPLLRSGSFGLVVIDFGSLPGLSAARLLPISAQSRLLGLAKRHRAACLGLRAGGPADRASLGSLVALRLEAVHQRHPSVGDPGGGSPGGGSPGGGSPGGGSPGGRFRISVRVLKDKGGTSPRLQDFELDGDAPDGLR